MPGDCASLRGALAPPGNSHLAKLWLPILACDLQVESR